MRIPRAALVAVASLPLAIALPASAQEARKLDAADTATVDSVDAPGLRFTVRGEGADETRTFRVDDHTRIRVGATDIPLSLLRPGDRVAVSATEEGPEATGPPVAQEVEVVQRSPAPPPLPTGAPELAPGAPAPEDPLPRAPSETLRTPGTPRMPSETPRMPSETPRMPSETGREATVPPVPTTVPPGVRQPTGASP